MNASEKHTIPMMARMNIFSQTNRGTGIEFKDLSKTPSLLSSG